MLKPMPAGYAQLSIFDLPADAPVVVPAERAAATALINRELAKLPKVPELKKPRAKKEAPAHDWLEPVWVEGPTFEGRRTFDVYYLGRRIGHVLEVKRGPWIVTATGTTSIKECATNKAATRYLLEEYKPGIRSYSVMRAIAGEGMCAAVQAVAREHGVTEIPDEGPKDFNYWSGFAEAREYSRRGWPNAALELERLWVKFPTFRDGYNDGWGT